MVIYVNRRRQTVYLFNLSTLHTHKSPFTPTSRRFFCLDVHIHIFISYSIRHTETRARSRERTFARIFAVDAEEVEYWSKGVRASGGISLFADRGVVALRRECTGDEWARWGVTVARRKPGNPRGIWERGRNARIECVCAPRERARSAPSALGSKHSRAPGIFTVCGCRVGGGTHVVSVGSEGGRSERQEIKTDEGEFWVSRRIRDADWCSRRVVSHEWCLATLRKKLAVAWVIARTLHPLWFLTFVIITFTSLLSRSKALQVSFIYYSCQCAWRRYLWSSRHQMS